MLRKIDPKFAAGHSQVHIESTSIAAARSAKAMQTIRVFDNRGALVERPGRDALLAQLRSGTCDLRRVIRDIRIASGQEPGPPSTRDTACGIK